MPVLPTIQEAPDSYGSPQAQSAPDNYGAPLDDDLSLPSYNAEPIQESYASPEAAEDSYGSPQDGSSEQESDQPSTSSLEDTASEEEINGVLSDSNSNDLQDVRYSGKKFDEPLFRDATPLKDSYSANEGTEGPVDDLVTTEANVGLEEATR